MKYPPNMSRPIRNGAFILPSGVIRPTEIRPHSAALPRIFSMMHECTALKRHAVRAYFPLSFRTALSREGSAFLMENHSGGQYESSISDRPAHIRRILHLQRNQSFQADGNNRAVRGRKKGAQTARGGDGYWGDDAAWRHQHFARH